MKLDNAKNKKSGMAVLYLNEKNSRFTKMPIAKVMRVCACIHFYRSLSFNFILTNTLWNDSDTLYVFAYEQRTSLAVVSEEKHKNQIGSDHLSIYSFVVIISLLLRVIFFLFFFRLYLNWIERHDKHKYICNTQRI